MALIDTSKLTPHEIANALWDEDLLDDVKAVEEEVSTVTVVKDAQGRKSQWTEEMTDMNKKLIRKRVDTYTYYPSGEVHTITQTVKDAQGNNLQHPVTIKHYTDGTPPTTQALTP